jgi:hypothetical protein
MSRYYIQPLQKINEKDRFNRDKRFDRYYDKDGKLVFNPDLSPCPGSEKELLTDFVQDSIFRKHNIIIPPDYIHNVFKTPKDKDIMVRMKFCGYDLPGNTAQTSSGADASDGNKFVFNEGDPRLAKKTPPRLQKISIEMDLIIPSSLNNLY